MHINQVPAGLQTQRSHLMWKRMKETFASIPTPRVCGAVAVAAVNLAAVCGDRVELSVAAVLVGLIAAVIG